MATPLLQKARQRKMIYFGAIVVLLTLSLIHREFILKPEATRLQLRETSRGEVELTSSAVRLMLTGSRGVAVTFLWYNAMEKQKRSEWNELELIVKSITKLQPYFITPWLFQSWNIAFNVAVECDRPHDKYYYVSRGLDLLAEGERRNSGNAARGAANDPNAIAIPGNPELRHFMGFIYQLKFGNSDENKTMRSLLEMSCIDPVERDPDKLANLTELAKFCQKYPRLVRRLHDRLGYTNADQILQFLRDHEKIPNRYKPIEKSRQGKIAQSDLKDPIDQFPILPPHEDPKWPDPTERELSRSESVDVFLVCRTWYQYALKPLPPADRAPRSGVPEYDKLKYRVPKGMMLQIFRQIAARAQVFMAEALDQEGFFDSDGWDMSRTFKRWARAGNVKRSDYIFGTEAKYHSQRAWRLGYDMYRDYGYRIGIYFPPDEFRKLWRDGSAEAKQKIKYSDSIRGITNFDAFLYQSEAESDAITIAMRKVLFAAHAERKDLSTSITAMELYDEAWNLFIHTCFKYPQFAQVSTIQEEIEETQIDVLKTLYQEVYKAEFKDAAFAAAEFASWQVGNGAELMNPAWPMVFTMKRVYWKAKKFDIVRSIEDKSEEMSKITPIRKRYGPLDVVQYYDGPRGKSDERYREGPVFMPGAKELKVDFLAPWIQAAGLGCGIGVPQAIAFPNGHDYFLLTRSTRFAPDTLPKEWLAVISPETRTLVAQRVGMNR